MHSGYPVVSSSGNHFVRAAHHHAEGPMTSTILILLVITLFAIFVLTASDPDKNFEPVDEIPPIEISSSDPAESLHESDPSIIDVSVADEATQEAALDCLAYPWSWLEADSVTGSMMKRSR
jgi:hypothetical protein